MSILKNADFEVPGFGEFAAPPVSVPAYSQAVNALGPTAYWRMGESSGATLVDQSATHPLALTGSYTLGQPGSLGSDNDDAILLDGGTAQSSLPVLPTTTAAAFSIVFWVRAPGPITQGGPFLTQLLTSDPGSFRLLLSLSGQVRYLLNGDTDLKTANIISTQWRMLILTRTTLGLVSWYVDGALHAQVNGSFGAVGSDVLKLGASNSNAPEVLLDEVAIFNDALSTDHARWLYALGSGQLALPLDS